MKNLNMIRETIETRRFRSAWDKGVLLYISDLLDQLEEAIDGGWLDDDDLLSPKLLERAMLNGASSWKQYSEGGCALCYNRDIARRLCTPSELRKTHDGMRDPNSRESWIDVQSRALYQAANAIQYAAATVRQFAAQADSEGEYLAF